VARIVNTVGCKDMARVDIRADSTGLHSIELNVNPGKNKFSYLMKSTYSLGLEYSEIISFIPYQALLRNGIQPAKKLEELVAPITSYFETDLAFETMMKMPVTEA